MASAHPGILLKTQQVARALGVSVSTVKRLVDSGVLPATKTVGRHRLIPLAEARAFARRQDLPRADLEMLVAIGVAKIEVVDDRVRLGLERALHAGEAREAKTLIRSAHASGCSVADLGDHLIRPVMERIGHGWQFGELDVFQEHRASQVVASTLVELIGQVSHGSDARPPLAIGATPEGDLYSLPALLCELLLREQGWVVVNLGPSLPLVSLAKATQEYRPRLVWLSVSHVADPGRFLEQYRRFYETATATGAAVILGGRALGPELRARLVATSLGDRLAHLAEFARLLHPTADRPDGMDQDGSPEFGTP
jgi:excisionase family DNA binding protein